MDEFSAFIKFAVKPRPSGRGCKAVTRKPPQGVYLVSLTKVGALDHIRHKKDITKLAFALQFLR